MSSFEQENVHKILLFYINVADFYQGKVYPTSYVCYVTCRMYILLHVRFGRVSARNVRSIKWYIGVLNVPADTVLPSVGFIISLV